MALTGCKEVCLFPCSGQREENAEREYEVLNNTYPMASCVFSMCLTKVRSVLLQELIALTFSEFCSTVRDNCMHLLALKLTIPPACHDQGRSFARGSNVYGTWEKILSNRCHGRIRAQMEKRRSLARLALITSSQQKYRPYHGGMSIAPIPHHQERRAVSVETGL